MEGLPNRKQRRQWAKQTGMLEKKRKAAFAEQMEINKRTLDMGNRIHFANVEKMLREEDAQRNKEKSRKVQELMNKGLTQEEALKIIEAE